MTELLYLSDSTIHSCDAELVDVRTSDGETAVIVSRTPYFPKGGGQANDIGRIGGADGYLDVTRVLRTDTEVLHLGTMSGHLRVGETVSLQIDVGVRHLNARLHTAGELLCAAVHFLGKSWPVTAACHLPGQARVAFASDLSPGAVSDFVAELRARLAELIERDEPVRAIADAPLEDVLRLCPLDTPTLDRKRGPIRLISPSAGFYRPCMGAHVEHIGEIGDVTILKARLRGGELSLSYTVSDPLTSPPC